MLGEGRLAFAGCLMGKRREGRGEDIPAGGFRMGGVAGYAGCEWVVAMGCCMEGIWPEEMGNATPKFGLGGVGAARVGVERAELGVEGLDCADLVDVDPCVVCRCKEKVNREKRIK